MRNEERSRNQTYIRIRFGVAVKQRRNELGLSQERLAHRAGLHRTYIGDIERGARNLSLENIQRLAEALQITIADLFDKYEVEDNRG